MHLFKRQTVLLFKRLLIVLAMFFAGRLYFFIHNLRYFAPAWPEDVLSSFFYGMQFDISAIVYFNLPFIMFHLLPGRYFTGSLNEKILRYYFLTVNGFLLFSNLIDAEYFRFTGKRTTSDIFSFIGLSEDIIKLAPRFVYDYWFIIVLGALLLFLANKLYPASPGIKENNIRFSPSGVAVHSVMMLLVTAFLISMARGYRLKPLRVITASNYVAAENIPLILNTPFTIMKSFNKHHLKVPEYFNMEKAEAIYSPYHNFSEKPGNDKLNVVIIIMESFSTEFSGYLTGSRGYMPFLDSLMKEALLFPNAFANAKKSLEALPAVLASIPALTETPFVSSPYSSNAINSLPGRLKELDYHTSFFHGGINGTMAFDVFTRLAGIEHYYGKNEFGNDDYFDGYWGIFDEQFLGFFADKLSSFPQPFFSCFFSLSSHHPYIIPGKYKGKFPEGELLIHESIGYADYSLRNFFNRVREQNWYRNTLFIITSDHTAQSLNPYFQNRIGDYAVPVIYYHPGNPELKGTNGRLTQHIDIMPSVIDYLGAGGRFVSFGNSVFSADTGFVVNHLNQIYQYMEDESVLFHDGYRSTGLYNFIKDSLLRHNYLESPEYDPAKHQTEHLENRLKSIIQQFNYRMVNNKLRAE